MKLKFLVLLTFLSVVKSAKILAFFNVPSRSHQFVFHAIIKELTLKGHEVTFVTPNPINDPNLKNLTEIDISIGYEIFKRFDLTNFNRDKQNFVSMIKTGTDFTKDLINLQMEVNDVKKLLKKPSNSYDLILVEGICPFFHGLEYKFKAPLITITSLSILNYYHEIAGNPAHPILYPHNMFTTYEYVDGSFWGKLDSLYVHLVHYFMMEFYSLPIYDEISRKYFGQDMPYLEKLVRNTSLMIGDANPIFSDRRPLVPNVINVWNLHLDRNDPLPKDLKSILDNAKNGVVYFSLGTNVRFDHVPPSFKKEINEALQKLPFTVLCKWEGIENTTNIHVRKWLPQQAILAHPNVRVFVTQGGLQSSEEAISNGVPLVVIPFLGDQPMNAKIIEKNGMSRTLVPSNVTSDYLVELIKEVATEPKYRENALRLRDIFLDQPQTGLEKIVWWCEYVIRHKGAKHLRSPSADISLVEYFMLDVFAFILFTLSLPPFLIYILYKFYKNSNNKKQIKKKSSTSQKTEMKKEHSPALASEKDRLQKEKQHLEEQLRRRN